VGTAKNAAVSGEAAARPFAVRSSRGQRRDAEVDDQILIAIDIMERSEVQKARALAKYREVGTVRGACRGAGIGRRTWYNWLEEDKSFAALVQEARDDVADELEEEASKRAKAKDGSDILLIFLLKALRPHKYRQNLKIDLVSPIVREKVRQTVSMIRTELYAATAARLLKRLGEVWK
jgi:hypothetical protein